MTKTSIVTLALTSLLLMGSVGESLAWEKHFRGTRAQVVNACSGPDMVLSNGATNSTCKNLKNGNIVDCNDAGNCTGAGTGPNPTRVVETGTIRGTVVAGATASTDEPAALTGSIVETILKWKLKGKKKVVDAPMEGPTPDPQSGGPAASDGSVLTGQGSSSGGSGHIGNGNGVRLGVFQAM